MKINADVRAICDPLFVDNKMGTFSYARYYDDGSASVLITDSDVYRIYFEKELIFLPRISHGLLKKNFYYIITPELEDGYSEFLKYFFDRFGIREGIMIFELHQDFVDVFCYTRKDLGAINYFINNMNLLNNFNLYFKWKAEKIIKKSEENKFILPKHMQPNFGGLDKNKIISNGLNIPKPKRYMLTGMYEKVFLTKMEFETVQNVFGKTSKQAAKTMVLSCRTVENYLENIRGKLGANNKKEIFEILEKNGLHHLRMEDLP